MRPERQPRTTEHSQLGIPSNDERKRNDVLTVADKPFGAVDGIQCPESLARQSGSPVDQRQQLMRINLGFNVPHGCQNSRHCLVSITASQTRGVLLRHQRVLGEFGCQTVGDESLHGEVRDCHRRPVRLQERFRPNRLPDFAREDGGFPDHTDSDVKLGRAGLLVRLSH